MPAFIDERLIDPRPEDLARRLVRATRAANGRLHRRRVGKDAAFWQRFVQRAQKKAEGQQRYSGGRSVGAALVKVAWWTDHVGRRHWRVVGRRTDWAESTEHSAFHPFALWHVYPERVMIRRRGGGDEAIVVCPCGAFGTPAEVGWTGQRCGPCHDRLEEGVPLPPGDCSPRLAGHQQWVSHLVFTADGRLLSAGYDGQVILWDLQRQTHCVLLRRPWGDVSFLTVSSAGMVAVSTANKRLMLRRLDPDEEWRTVRLPISNIRGAQFSPDGRRLVLATRRGLWLLDVEAAESPSALTQLMTSPAAQAVFTPDGRSLVALAEDHGIRRLDLPSGASTVLYETESLGEAALERMLNDMCSIAAPAVSPDGRLASVGYFGGRLGLYVGDLATRRWRLLFEVDWVEDLAAVRFLPDGLLAVARRERLELWEPAGRLVETLLPAPAPNESDRRAFSADGSLVAGAAQDGCAIRVWPWRRAIS